MSARRAARPCAHLVAIGRDQDRPGMTRTAQNDEGTHELKPLELEIALRCTLVMRRGDAESPVSMNNGQGEVRFGSNETSLNSYIRIQSFGMDSIVALAR
jgi:hypothetical protein